MSLFLQDADFTLYQGDAVEMLRTMPDESVHCVVTSPPYWGLRDYGTGTWKGGNPDCDHTTARSRGEDTEGWKQSTSAGSRPNTQTLCACGARRVDQQLGLEPTPDAYVHNMVELFREVRRVLRRDGTCWLNLGDSYNANRGAGFNGQERQDHANRHTVMPRVGFKPKDLVGIPWRVAFALQADGWYLRSDIIWSKPNPMPESVTDRPTKAHEYLFLLTRSARYFYDADAIREPAEWARWGDQTYSPEAENIYGQRIRPRTKREIQRMSREIASVNGRGQSSKGIDSGEIEASHVMQTNPAGRNARSVWEIATQPYPEAHFATFPEELARRCIAAGTSERGCCPECGAPWERETDVSYEKAPVHGAGSVVGRHYETGANNFDGAGMPRLNKRVETTGWRPSYECGDEQGVIGQVGTVAHDSIPCVVLDPFMGSGTVAHVARKLGRRSIGIELNTDYCELAAKRLAQQSLLAEDIA